LSNSGHIAGRIQKVYILDENGKGDENTIARLLPFHQILQTLLLTSRGNCRLNQVLHLQYGRL
ncbi:MAG: hypothetical protein PF542_00005, partial [Nanoarchaeota archaeon]|nr:hypothetical protein [Nanoarchaeota archaeon]